MEQRVFTVSEFISTLNLTLNEAVFPYGVTIEGEVSEYRLSQNKWVWFVLKDKEAALSCFATVWQVRTPLEDGMRIKIFGKPHLYPKSGKFSITVEKVELVGEGALKRAFELLKKKFADEGLFAPERKRPIPRFPETIGLIASRESAAYGDFMRILGNRWGGVKVSLAHAQVQGSRAVSDIVGAFRYFQTLAAPPDVLVLARGGGSLEDLQAFNSEEVARAIFSSKIPVVVGVGHERDETIADFVADVRASTPSNAAELVVPAREEVLSELSFFVKRMDAAVAYALQARRGELGDNINRIQTHALEFEHRFNVVTRNFYNYFRAFALRARENRRRSELFAENLFQRTRLWLGRLASRVEGEERLMKGLDPRELLRRGYSIAFDKNGKILKDASAVDLGETIKVQLLKGSLRANVVDRFS